MPEGIGSGVTRSDVTGLHRRDFARCLVLGSGAALGPSGFAAIAAPPDNDTQDPPKPPSYEALLLTALVQQYPAGELTDGVLGHIYQDIAFDRIRAEQLAQVALTSADEPALWFQPRPVAS